MGAAGARGLIAVLLALALGPVGVAQARGAEGRLATPGVPATLDLVPMSATLPTGTQHCVVATVADAEGFAVRGVVVAFAVVGANPTGGQLSTDAAGQAEFCYSGTLVGTDTITATLGTLSKSVTVTWATLLALTVRTDGVGAVTVSPAPAGSGGVPGTVVYRYPPGTIVSLLATPGDGQLLARWAFDGAGDPPYGRGWANPLTITLDDAHSATAYFVPRPAFNDLAPNDAATLPATELAARGIAKGYGAAGCAALVPPVAAPCYGAANRTSRAETAAFLTRLLGVQNEDHGVVPFSDVAELDPELRRAIGTLAFYGILKGYEDGRFGPLNEVTHLELALLIARSLVFKGYWARATADDPSIYPNLPIGADARLDLVTFVRNAGLLPGFANGTGRAPLDLPAPRGWAAQALWQALNAHFGVDAPGKGGFVP